MSTQPEAEQVSVNRLLAALPPDELDRIRTSLTVRRFEPGDEISAPWQPVSELIFPTDSIVSVVSETSAGHSVEVATVGREGINGASAFLAASPLPMRSICQIGGEALVGRTADLVSEFGESQLRVLVLRYTQTMLVQASVTASCNRLHPLEQRAARWLLTVADRLGRDSFQLTHEFFAVLLGSHRPSVSLAAQMLAKGGLISYRRGELKILDAPGLAAAACECYGIINQHFAMTMGYELGEPQHR